MIIYLDQNKWIELSKMVHGKDDSQRAKRIVRAMESVCTAGHVTLPLSAIHYMETSRISNEGRKVRLGSTMWRFSRGQTIAGYPAVVRHELDVALSKHFAHIVPGELQVIGFGHAHAFGEAAGNVPSIFAEEFERSMLMGNELLRIPPLASYASHHRESFRNHLASLHIRAAEVSPDLRENFLYAISTVDILEPLSQAMVKYELPANTLEILGETGLKKLINDMPTLRVDLHLHRQVLRNPTYAPKPTDLEDWAALAMAACYCDVVVCEKHMANMLSRDGFRTKTRIEADLDQTFTTLAPT